MGATLRVEISEPPQVDDDLSGSLAGSYRKQDVQPGWLVVTRPFVGEPTLAGVEVVEIELQPRSVGGSFEDLERGAVQAGGYIVTSDGGRRPFIGLVYRV